MPYDSTTPALMPSATVAPAAAAFDVSNYLDSLKVEHTQWSETQRHTTNAGLYKLLSKCMKFYEEMVSTGGGAQRVCDDFNAYLKLNKMKFSSVPTHSKASVDRWRGLSGLGDIWR